MNDTHVLFYQIPKGDVGSTNSETLYNYFSRKEMPSHGRVSTLLCYISDYFI